MFKIPSVEILPHGVTLSVMQIVSVIAISIHLPTIPAMATTFGTSPSEVSSTMSGYLIVGAMLQLCFGSVSDFVGRRMFTLLSLAAFTLASVGCALSTNLVTFSVFRNCQGVAMVLTVLSRAIVAESRDEYAAGSILGYIASAMAVVTILSPIIGGVLGSSFGWRAVFWTSAFLGGLACLFCWMTLPETIVSQRITSRKLWHDYRITFSSKRFLGCALGIASSLATYYAFLVAAPVAGANLYSTQFSLGVFISLMTMGFLVGSFVSGRASLHMGTFVTVMSGRLISVAGLLLGLFFICITPNKMIFLLPVPVFLAGLGDGITVPAATGAMLTGKDIPPGTGAALSGVGILGFGALVSLVVGQIAKNGLDITTMLILMLIPAIVATIPLLLVLRIKQV